jgi:hypothetical protein
LSHSEQSKIIFFKKEGNHIALLMSERISYRNQLISSEIMTKQQENAEANS